MRKQLLHELCERGRGDLHEFLTQPPHGARLNQPKQLDNRANHQTDLGIDNFLIHDPALIFSDLTFFKY